MRQRPILTPALSFGSLWLLALHFAIGCSQDDPPDMFDHVDPALRDRNQRDFNELLHPLGRKVSMQKLNEHLEFLTRGLRNPGSSDLEASRLYCARQLESFGYDVQQIPVEGTDFVNVVGTRLGVYEPDKRVILSAHIDGVPNCAGADDNATGVAGVLEAARVLAKRDHSSTLIVACWDGEEQGLTGSMDYAAKQRELGAEIQVAFVLEMIGFTSSEPNSQQLPVSAEEEPLFNLAFPEAYQAFVANDRRGDFIALVHDTPGAFAPVGANLAAESFLSADGSSALKVLVLPLTAAIAELLPDTTRSDHAAFWRHGYSAIMITDTANLRNPNYHCRDGEDSLATLDLSFMTRVTRTTVGAVVRELERW